MTEQGRVVDRLELITLLSAGVQLDEHPQEPEPTRWFLSGTGSSEKRYVDHELATSVVAEPDTVWLSGWGRREGSPEPTVRYWLRRVRRRLADG